jgi:hypothetical protein
VKFQLMRIQPPRRGMREAEMKATVTAVGLQSPSGVSDMKPLCKKLY